MISKLVVSFAVMFALSASQAQAAWLVKQVKTDPSKAAKVLSAQHVDRAVKGEKQVLRSFPRFLSEDVPPSGGIYEEILYTDQAAPKVAREFKAGPAYKFDGATEVRTIVEQGPKENRINLTMVGDGYTLAEKEKFFSDAARIKDDLFANQAYSTYLPLFNVYAVFVESKESGLTDGSHTVNTALGLYRDPPGSKRGIMPGNTTAIDAAIALAPASDYPILIANDDFYGGLGGEYAITTRSVQSGIIVLRHELGHNFGQVGEEYDMGQVYTGANSSPTADNLTWAHWLTNTTPQQHVYESKFLAGDYVWKPLNQGAYTSTFNFPAPAGNVPYDFEVIISAVGWSTPDDVYVYFDGQKVDLEGLYTNDRSFFTFRLPQSPAPGSHTLEVKENISDGDNVLAFAELYAQPDGFDTIPDEVAAYATFDEGGNKTYRPTHASCPMRNMKHESFCPVDVENMWTRFLARVKLVDDGTITGTDTRDIDVKTPPLPGLDIHWYTVDSAGAETEVPGLHGKTSWQADANTHGLYRAKLHFQTDQVRKYTTDFDATKDFKL
jgi:hypothetical protein